MGEQMRKTNSPYRLEKVEKMMMMMFMSLSISTGDYYIHSRPLVDVAVLLFIETHAR
jgi:hypothetical protein